jgi:hypothetical protein
MTKRAVEPVPEGQQFGELTALREGPPTGSRGRRTIVCKCSCGQEKTIALEKLRSGHTRSCGCQQRAAASTTGKQNRTHGKTLERIYTIWHGLVGRCRTPSNTSYPRYGALGIQVCDEWAESFDAFYRDMGDPPSDLHTVDRRDTKGHYTPENCRWVTMEVQQNNRCNNVNLTVDGRTQSVAVWARERGIPEDTIRYRLKRGWSHAEAVNGRQRPAA